LIQREEEWSQVDPDVVVSGMAEKTPPKIIKILPNGYFIAHYK
jgi:hypothetical protein